MFGAGHGGGTKQGLGAQSNVREEGSAPVFVATEGKELVS